MLPSFFVVASPVLTATLNTLCSLRVLQRLTLTSCNGSTLAWRLPFATSEAAVCFSMLFFARVSPFSSCLLRTCLPLFLVSSSHVSPPYPRVFFARVSPFSSCIDFAASFCVYISPLSPPPPPPPSSCSSSLCLSVPVSSFFSSSSSSSPPSHLFRSAASQ